MGFIRKYCKNSFKISQVIAFIYLSLFLWLVLILPLEIITKRFLFMDGREHFSMLLSRHDFHNDAIRQFGIYVLQLPIVTAMKVFQIKETSLLCSIYGMSLIYIPFLLFIASAIVMHKDQKSFLLPLMACFSFLSVNNSLFAVSESHLATSLYWITFFSIVSYELNCSIRSMIIGVLSAAIGSRTYEGFLFNYLFLALISLHLIICYWKKRDFKNAWILTPLFLFLFYCFIEFQFWIFMPRNLWRSKVNPPGELLELFKSPFFLISMVLLMVFIADFFFQLPRRFENMIRTKYGYLLICVLIGYSFYSIRNMDSEYLRLQFNGRHLNAIAAFWVSMLIWLKRNDIQNFDFQKKKPALISLALLITLSFFWNLFVIARWTSPIVSAFAFH
jgi:hypothetical protein